MPTEQIPHQDPQHHLKSVTFLGIVLALLILLPVAMDHFGLRDRRAAFYSIGAWATNFMYMHREIYEKKTDLDLVFIGPSTLLTAIDVPYVQENLSANLGRQTQVEMFGYTNYAFDFDVLLLSELVQRRKVGMVVISSPDPSIDQPGPHSTNLRFLQYRDLAVLSPNLSLAHKLALSTVVAVTAPRQLYWYLRHPAVKLPQSIIQNHGAMPLDSGYYGAPFVNFTPPLPKISVDEMIYSESNKDHYHFNETPLPAYQSNMMKKFMSVADRYGVKVVLLSIPNTIAPKSEMLSERLLWPEFLGKSVSMIGVRPSILFQGMDQLTVEKLFANSSHLNRNGAHYFTRVVFPAIEKTYLESVGGSKN